MALSKDCYQPGETNINRYEAQLRRESAIINLLISVALFVFLKTISANALWYLLLFIPLFLSSLGFIQSKNKFCANFALRGLQNAARVIDAPSHVVSERARTEDRKRASRLLIYAGLTALVSTLVILFFMA